MDYRTDLLALPLLRLQEDLQLFPAYVDDAAWDDMQQPRGKCAFANPAAQEFPLHSPAAVWLGAAYAAGAPLYDIQVPDTVLTNIKEAAVLFGIEKDVDAVIEYQTRTVKEASAPDFDIYALRDGEQVFYPTGTQFDIQESAAGLARDYELQRIPTKQARQAAEQILKRAAATKTPMSCIPDRVTLLGTPTRFDLDQARKFAAWRDRELNTTLYSDTLPDGFVSETMRDETVDLWRDIDQHFGFKAAAWAPAPEVVLLAGVPVQETDKVAASTVFFGDKPVPAVAFSCIPDEAVSAWYPNSQESAACLGVIKAAAVNGLEATLLLDAMQDDLRRDFAGRVSSFHAHRKAQKR